ncbi:MAG: protein kinase domain-containing protein [Planctomycetota bacterium]|jgi:serine/threonine protein kinase
MGGTPQQIGPYTVDAQIGQGGMGVVYRATDTRLDRAVAIKALPEHFASEPERLARFEREAKTLASLNHPNVAGIHGIESQDGSSYIIMEYVDGQTLGDLLDSGPLPSDDAIDVCKQIALGLEAAHDAGVIHRDLKPANIKIDSEGRVKILDFGLARTEENSSSGSSVSQLPTLTTPGSPTTPGAILGTAPYMSPEQARGRRVDKRSDIWSFGVVLYECLTGSSPFIGETATDSIGAILHKDVDLGLLPRDTQASVRRVVTRCLERNKSSRLHDIADARIELENPTSLEPESAAQRASNSPFLWIAIAALLVIATSASWKAWLLPEREAPLPNAIHSTILPPAGTSIISVGDLAGPAEVYRDGTKLVFVAKPEGEQQRLYLQHLNQTSPEPLRGTESATFPFWSWDGTSIGYFANGQMRRYDLESRTNHTIIDAPGGRGGAWLVDDTIVYAPGFQSSIMRISPDGGEPTPVSTIDAARHTSHRWPKPTTDGLGFTYVATNHQPGFLDECALFLSNSADHNDVEITRSQYSGVIVNGRVIVLRDGNLLAYPINEKTGSITGDARVIAENVGGDLTTWNAPFSVSHTGVLLYHQRIEGSLADRSELQTTTFGEANATLIVDRDGRPRQIIASGVPQNTTSLSPVGYELVISGAPEGQTGRAGFDLWIYTLPTPLAGLDEEEANRAQLEINAQRVLDLPPRRLTFADGIEFSPVWSPDGQWIAFSHIYGIDTQESGLKRIRVSGGQPELLIPFEDVDPSLNALIPSDWSADGRYIIYERGAFIATGRNDIYAYDLETNESLPLVLREGDDRNGTLSPNGKWLAYQGNTSGTEEINVIPFMPNWQDEIDQGLPAPESNAIWRVSIAGGRSPAWNRVANELYYISPSGSMIMVNVDTSSHAFSYDVGQALFSASSESGVDFNVSFDGQRFAINDVTSDKNSDISMLINWMSLLEE